MSIWKVLNGRKTNLAAAAAAVMALLHAVGVRLDPQTEKAINDVIGALATIGLAHKAMKAREKRAAGDDEEPIQ